MEKIDGSPALPLRSLLGQGQGQATSADKPANKPADANLGGENTAVSAKDRLTIDGTTRTLRNAEATLNEGVPVDSEKVARIRQAIEQGSYNIDAGRIADNLLAVEKSLYQK